MTARSVARWHALGRLALGGGLLAAPGAVAGPWVGGVADKSGGRTLAVGFGARDVGIALGELGALRTGGSVRPWLRAAMLADAVDLVATLRARDSLPALTVPVVAAMAGGSVVLAGWLHAALD